MVSTSKVLLQELLNITRENLNVAESFKEHSKETLNWRLHSESWSVLECVAHLNRYGMFYIPEINQKIDKSPHKNTEFFKSNALGKYFSKAVSYQKELNKMKTFTSMNPIHSKLDHDTLDLFITQQHQIIALLDKAKDINLDKTKTLISISKWIKIRLGDSFRVLIYHNQRHIKQAEKVLLERT